MRAERYDAATPDGVLIAAFLKGDEAAFEVLYYRYRSVFYGFLRNLIRRDDEVDDVFSETWCKVVKKLPEYHDDGKFSAWLFRVGRNIYFDRIRSKKALSAGQISIDAENVPEPMDKTYEHPEAVAAEQEFANALTKAVNELPDEQREVFLLRQRRFSFQEIAEIRNCSINTALSRMQYALKGLRMRLKEFSGVKVTYR